MLQERSMKQSRSDSDTSMDSDDERDIFDDDDIEEVLQDFSNSISREKALDFLHTLASSKSILYWNSHGEMLYHQRRIPVTSIAELVEYAILPYSLDVKAPRGLNTFTKGLAEIGIDKKLIGNKRLLADLVARQPEEEDSDLSDSQTTVSSEIQNSDGDEDDENEQETDKISASESVESGSESEPEECHVCRDFRPFYSIPVVQCPRCLWREGYYERDNHMIECDICRHIFPVDSHTTKTKFIRCQECDAVHQMSLKRKKLKLIKPNHNNDEEEQEESE